MEPMSGNLRVGRFTDLSGSYHHAASKVLLCEEQIRSKLTPFAFAKNHGIPAASMIRMAASYSSDQVSGISTFRDAGSGRPSKLDQIGRTTVKNEVIRRTTEQHAPTKLEYQNMVLNEVTQTQKRRNRAEECPEICKRTLNNYKNDMNVDEGQAQLKTHARIAAEGDPRNAFSKEQGEADKVAAREKREIDKDAAKVRKEVQQAERDAFNKLSPAEKKVARKAKKEANAALKAAQQASPLNQELPGAAAVDEDGEDLHIFGDEEIYGEADDQ